MSAEDRRQRAVEGRLFLDRAQPAHESVAQALVLLFETAVALRFLAAKVTRGRGIGHHDELDLFAAAACQTEIGRLGGEVKPPGRQQVAIARRGGSSECHHIT